MTTVLAPAVTGNINTTAYTARSTNRFTNVTPAGTERRPSQ